MAKKYNQGPQNIKRKPKKPQKKKGLTFRRHRAHALGKRGPVGGTELALPPEDKKMGRPEAITEELAQTILERLANGETVTAICSDVGMPHPATVLRKCMRDPLFKKRYDEAREIGYQVWADQTRDIADTMEEREKVTEKIGGKDGPSTTITTEDAIEHRKLRIGTRHWLMERADPRRFGAKTQIEQKSSLLVQVQKIETVVIDDAGNAPQVGLIEHEPSSTESSE